MTYQPTVDERTAPAGAIENGRVLADRLESYSFESEGGDLRLCSDWVEFRRCFEYLAEWACRPAPAAGDARDSERLNFLARHEARVIWSADRGCCAVVRYNKGSLEPMTKWGNNWPTARQAIDAAIDAQRQGDA